MKGKSRAQAACPTTGSQILERSKLLVMIGTAEDHHSNPMKIALSEGEVDGCTLECWLHGSRFDLRTGKPVNLPATEPVQTFPTTIDGDTVLVDLSASGADNA